jgi:hypothetical protein
MHLRGGAFPRKACRLRESDPAELFAQGLVVYDAIYGSGDLLD